MKSGVVYLVGAGPGDPKLITIRGKEAIERADVIVYDRLASPRLLKYRKPTAELIFVGKHPDKDVLHQTEINQLLVDLALQGKTVTRLKGGDPSVFGRVGEEAELLADHQISYEIIPGISSAIAVPIYAGIPVTHRDYTSSVAIITGHEYPENTYSSLEWEHLAQAVGTMIFLKGVANIEQIAIELIRHGKPKDMPVALIRWGTTVEQQTLTGTLEDIASKVKAHHFKPPAVIIVGEVVSLREKLAWIEKKPLFGKRILVTRARSQSSELVALIDDQGGEAIEFPVIAIQPISDPQAIQRLDHAISMIAEFDWCVFTSVNAVDYFFRRLHVLQVDIRRMSKARIVAIGPKTYEALCTRGLIPEEVPAVFQSEGILNVLAEHVQPGERVLWPKANLARGLLSQQLVAKGLDVCEVDVYENILQLDDDEGAVERLTQHQIDIVTFTSSSTVTNLIEALQLCHVSDPIEVLSQVEIACIGPKTDETLRKYGLTATYIAKEATVVSLVEAIANHPTRSSS
jgi:uroporphyrinogen III methyltransferase/synthase